ncbi:PilV [Collimonas arenae]|uniref:PilV n=1 Tax=Collimonas arenae TaxID=279058 RepID=A0A0A1F770_9BURK|nr:shufflon system plasmid conjugative transfer pilus tip adhesin PilV [Collimonas arenae]AIY39645.1 PilV [Collimonas arenae]
MNRLQHGFTLLELMAALAIGAMMILGLSVMIDRSLDDTKAQQTALYQAQVAAATGKYIVENYADLVSRASETSAVAVNVEALKNTGHLSRNFNLTNAYGQTPCVLVLKTPEGHLDALVVTEGGDSILAKDIAYIAGNAGQGGGYFDSGAPLQAKGAFGSWALQETGTPALNNFMSAKCDKNATTGAGHLATALFYDGLGQPTTDFVYRGAVPGHPELNAMTTPLQLPKVARENTSDRLCTAADATTYGRIAVNNIGAVLSCQAGVWRYGGGSWKEPVSDYESLPPGGPGSANVTGDVRMVTGKNVAFTWTADNAWSPLAVDQNGNLNVPQRLTVNDVLIQAQITAGTRCDKNGLIAADSTGMAISCQSGIWRKFAESEIIPTGQGDPVRTWSYKQQAPDGDYEYWLDLSTVSGSRPLFVSGLNRCKSYDNNESSAYAEYIDASRIASLGYVGGCASLSNVYSNTKSNGVVAQPDGTYPTSGGDLQIRVMAGNYMALQKIPENAGWLHVVMRSKGSPENYTRMWLTIFNSR